jgi:hypothetical protein
MKRHLARIRAVLDRLEDGPVGDALGVALLFAVLWLVLLIGEHP